MPKAVYHGGCHNKHNCAMWESLAPLSGVLPLDHSDKQWEDRTHLCHWVIDML